MEQKNWFVFKGDHHIGPFSKEVLLEKLKLGNISEEEMVWSEGDDKWHPLHSHPELMIMKPIPELQPVGEPVSGKYSVDHENFDRDENHDVKADMEQLVKEGDPSDIVPIAEEVVSEQLPELPDLPELPKPEPEPEPQSVSESAPDSEDFYIDEEVDIEAALHSRPDVVTADESESDLDEEEPFEFQTLSVPKNNSGEDDTSPFELPNIPLDHDKSDDNDDNDEEWEEDTGDYDVSDLEAATASHSNRNDKDEDDEDDNNAVEDEDDYYIEEKQSIGMRSMVLGIIALVFVTSFALYFGNNLSMRKVYLKGLSPGAKKSLESLSQKSFSAKSYYRLAPTTDGSKVFLATNLKGDFTVNASFESIKGRILSKDSIAFQAQGQIVDGLAEFNKFELLKGTEMIPGEYLVKLIIRPSGMADQIKSTLINAPVFKDLTFIKTFKKSRKYETKFLLYPRGSEKFEQAIVEYNKKIETQLIRPLKEQIERYQTFLSLREKLQVLWEDYIGRITKGSSIKFFENKYNVNIGPLIRDLVIDSNRIHISYLNTDPEKSKSYEEIMVFGKDIGYVASEMVVQTRRYKVIGRSNRKKLQERFSLKLSELKERGENHLRSLENEIKSFEN
tara:strand:+ start:231697 stop:233550 length:1854 start_codon:yes stop_codon:yes gene_type:complete